MTEEYRSGKTGRGGKEMMMGEPILQTGDTGVAYRWEGKNEKKKIGGDEGDMTSNTE